MLNFLKKITGSSERALTSEQRAFWDDNGYLILPKFFAPETIAAVNAEVRGLLEHRDRYPEVTVDIISGELSGRRMRIADVPASAFSGPVKINDLFLDSSVIRSCNLDARLTQVLDELLDGDPMVCNSLNFLYGSAQTAHYDSWFMPPPVKDKMAVSSICLDTYTDRNGPLFVYPGSHKIPPYLFPNGSIAALGYDLAPAQAYVAETTREIEPVYFYGEPGDVLIWHSQVLHGGAPILDPTQTRRSLVTHYWRAQDVPAARRTRLTDNGYVLKREHQALH
ncbi:phytanoyl-CoA dioxygenase family protein [Methylobacterium oxalidis]|uniref:Phytanoyl-CoA dioxygenase n=1 Tax=Methylobacterium oxalidis TaxID=944322 RepID=A0A512J460_9HYPH|nr:phytanoyl-CoA dioxygenase family protein [Methylobacterium oxalidis]GEP04741.1 hypothetical protein MOX02_27790 [Methylobacterium oxalidis]GJE30441.1 hypothetical protein LDDCCGHA_0609 [Methylobacterium oxalidis]GLS63567.1 hypothetical protein GCM10007888_19480 [Methylobacterium oxalidis]